MIGAAIFVAFIVAIVGVPAVVLVHLYPADDA